MTSPMRNALALALVAVCLLSTLEMGQGMVVVASDASHYDAMSDMVASFGPPVPADGIAGDLVLADPLEGCAPLTPPRLPPGDARWVALIARSHARTDDCTFDVKVRHAEAAGAVAAVIYDDIFEGLLVMAAPPGNPEPGIPSVFVSQASGALMRQMLVPGQTKVFISPSPSLLWASMVMSAFAGCLAVSVVMSAFYLARRPPAGLAEEDGGGETPPAPPPRRRRPTLPPEQLRLLPVLVHEERGGGDGSDIGSDTEEDRAERPSASAGATPARAGDTKRLCAICLEQYVAGDKLRLLPCQHRYHRECIDPWLSRNSLACPVCKADTGAALAAAAAADLEAGEGGSGGAGGGEAAAAAGEEGPGVRRAAAAALGALQERWAAWRGGRRGAEAPEEAQRRLLPLVEGRQRAPADVPGAAPPPTV